MRHRIRLRALAAAASVVLVTGIAPGGGAGAVSLSGPDMLVRMVGGDPDQRERVWLAILRFADAGLTLPPLDIEFGEPGDCTGGYGVFTSTTPRWRVTICSQNDWVSEHELAHAWERATLTDALRRDFTDFLGLPSWADPNHEWNRRGVEAVAVVIQQGIAGLPLPLVLGEATKMKLRGYEMLTGRPAPRLVEWLGARPVPCQERPTPLSLGVPDVSGATCQLAGEAARE